MRRLDNYFETRAKEENKLDILKKHQDQDIDDEPYIEGKEKLNFSYIFSTGEIFNAFENKKGIAKFTISKEGKEIVNFKDFLPKEVKFVTPTYVKKMQPGEVLSEIKSQGIGRFLFSPQGGVLTVGSIHDIKSVLSLMHEIGHARLYEGMEEFNKFIEARLRLTKKDAPTITVGDKNYNAWDNPEDIDKIMDNASKTESQQFSKQLKQFVHKISDPKYLKKNEIERDSIKERTAWAEALSVVRKINKQNGISLLEGYNSFDEVKESIESALITHRYSSERDMHSGFLGHCSLALGIAPTKEDLDFLADLFDKNRLLKKKI